MIVVVLWIMFVFIMGHVHVLVGSLALIVNAAMTILLNTLIKNGNNLVMLREPLIILTISCTKPLTKVDLSTQNSWMSNKQEKLV